jgi:hypothetical protein
MFRPSLGRMLAVVVVSLLLATPWCSAAWQKPPNPNQAVRPTASTPPELAHHLWGWLTTQWTKVGCSIDPSGRRACTSALTTSPETLQNEGDVGCSIDPSGILSCGM